MLLKESSSAQASWLTPRRGMWLLVVCAVAIAAVLALRLTQALAIKDSNAKRHELPTVTVTRVAVSTTPTIISIVGTIAARYDMPIGVEGDGGRVAAIYVEAGDRVKRGQVLARLNVSVLQPQVANLEAGLEQARAEAELATAEYHRAEAVGASGALSAEETQRRKSSAVTAAAKVKVAAALLAEARARLARAEVRAPADGVILTRNVEVGQTASPGGEALFRLSKGGEIELRGQVPEQDLPLLKVGQTVSVLLTGSTQSYPGRVALEPDQNLRPGAFARAEVTISNGERAVLPQTAVLTDDHGSYVLIVDAQNKVARRAVRVSGMVQNGVTIAGGLNSEERVIATAGAFLQEGELVRPVSKDSSGS